MESQARGQIIEARHRSQTFIFKDLSVFERLLHRSNIQQCGISRGSWGLLARICLAFTHLAAHHDHDPQ